MDSYVEKKYIEDLKAGDVSRFLPLFDLSFDALYGYVRKRIADPAEIERIVRLTFLDAFSKTGEVFAENSFSIWLYSLAKPRVWSYLQKKARFERLQDLCDFADVSPDFVDKIQKMLDKLSLEEREIVYLKYFEEASDGEISVVLNEEFSLLGPRIYRVLKRAHFLLLGETEVASGVYLGELGGFLSRVRNLMRFVVPKALKLNIRAEISMKIQRKDMALDVEVLNERVAEKEAQKLREGLLKRTGGSSDPAKVFVEAAGALSSEEKEARYDMYRKQKEIQEESEFRRAQKREEFLDAVERRKGLLILVPVLILILTAGVLVLKMVDWEALFKKSACNFTVGFNGELSEKEKKDINAQISERICKKFVAEAIAVSKLGDGSLRVNVDLADRFLEYEFDTRNTRNWYIQYYERSGFSYTQSRKISRNI